MHQHQKQRHDETIVHKSTKRSTYVFACNQAKAAEFERQNSLLSLELMEGIDKLSEFRQQASMLSDENARLKEELANAIDANDATTVRKQTQHIYYKYIIT